jgi:hypothetical protein
MTEPSPNAAAAQNPDIDPAITNGLAQQASTEQPADVEMTDSGAVAAVSLYPSSLKHNNNQKPLLTPPSHPFKTPNPKLKPTSNQPSKQSRQHLQPLRPHPHLLLPSPQRPHPHLQHRRATRLTRLLKRRLNPFHTAARQECISISM